MTIRTVASTAALINALKSARNGDVIKLEAGTYSGVVLRDLKLDNVTIQSKDAAKPAVFTDLLVRNASGLDFSNIEFRVDPNKLGFQFQVVGSSDINFDRLNVHGTLDGNPADDKSGLIIRESRHVSVTNSEFQQLDNALSHLNSEYLHFSGNRFHDIRTDGVRGGGSSNVKVVNNHFTDFYPAPGDHPDAIQFWTGGTTASAVNIEVSGNIIVRGSGGPVQGIFFRDQGDSLPYQNVSITGNSVTGGMWNGIMVDGGRNITIADNRVFSLPDMKSYIRVENVDLAVVANNSALHYLYINSSRVTELNNEKNTFVQDGAWQVPAASPATVAEPPAVKVLLGTDGADRLQVAATTGTRIEAGAGNDSIIGGAGENTLIGGAGDDNYTITDCDDMVVEEASGGIDTVWAAADHILADHVENLRLSGSARVGTGNDQDNRILGTSSGDRLSGLAGSDSLIGGAGDDTLAGGTGDDQLNGDEGNDLLQGDAGNDNLIGGNGADLLEGGDGDDQLEGGAGADTLVGGSGADRFFYRQADLLDGSIDVIQGFSSAQGDKILLSMIDADLSTALNDKFVFVGTKAFSGKAGELRYESKDGSALVSGDLDGDRIADFTIAITGASSLAASDFSL
jgi:Ca2+-binding RTX toxin-like protein